jgi:hypothetical protein
MSAVCCQSIPHGRRLMQEDDPYVTTQKIQAIRQRISEGL